MKHQPIRGRGAADNPKHRFTDEKLEYDPDEKTGRLERPKTKILTDHTKEIISTNQSPDIPFEVSLNPYRGCEHGCAYCYARPSHEFLGMSAGLDFESKIVAKYNAPELLREKLSGESWKPKPIVMSGVTDPYQPLEKELRITRGCVEVLAESLHPLVIITKNYGVTRDIDLLKKLAEVNAVRVVLSITSLDRDLIGSLEPRTSRPEKRLQAVEELTRAGIPVHANIAPLIPGLTDDEIVPIMEAAKNAGASSVSYTILRLPYSVKDIFLKWLDDHQPNRKQKVVNKVKSLKDGQLNRSEFGKRFHGEGAYGEQIRQLFSIHKKRLGLEGDRKPLNTSAFRRPSTAQLRLF
ncbi:PA0069 family radical SAM protein [Rhodohalobacter sp. SW132]|uniref:PA0069 family radical SAM protein n=1 Tax=Rhodohalobacter sp. SW132 TaxID=2293433 RepID=UPI000E2339E5|nr:PA0069 family radical SAM protein [Rhodohalobacter sp. SW132]REL33415.1 PA0069 family radical SAM protein [Rhodohalobacter sp. SW132]